MLQSGIKCLPYPALKIRAFQSQASGSDHRRPRFIFLYHRETVSICAKDRTDRVSMCVHVCPGGKEMKVSVVCFITTRRRSMIITDYNLLRES